MKLPIFLSSILTILPLITAEDLQTCGAAQYYLSKYTCFDTQLCPKTAYGEAYVACGTACYDAGTYYCDAATQLQLITPDSQVQYCGAAPYKPGEYTCFGGSFLCPVVNGEATLACGGTACYSPRDYACTNGHLGTPAEVPPPTCGGLYQTCGYNGNLPCCSDKYYCAASKCRPFPARVKKAVAGVL